jgi:hypothetical protein
MQNNAGSLSDPLTYHLDSFGAPQPLLPYPAPLSSPCQEYGELMEVEECRKVGVPDVKWKKKL